MQRRGVTKIVLLVVGSIYAILGNGCKQNIGGSSWDVDVLAPLVSTQLTMGNLLTDSLLSEDADGRLRLKFETDLIGLEIDSIVRIPDTTVENSVSFPNNITNLPPGSEFPPIPGITRFNLGGIALKKARLRQGTLKVALRSVIPTPVDFYYAMPSASIGGTSFEFTSSVEAGSASEPAVREFEFNLQGYEFDLRGQTLTDVNTLASFYRIKTAVDGNTISIPANQAFFFMEYSFIGIVPDYGVGYFGQQTDIIEEELDDIDVLSSITHGQLLLDSVTIDLSVVNGVGADAVFRMEQLQSINSRTGVTVDLQHALVGSSQPITRAIDLDGTAEGVQASRLDFRLDNGNSNIKNVITNLPDKLKFRFNFSLNPLGNVSLGNDFFYYDRPFEAKLAMNVPIRFSMENLTLTDSVDFDLGGDAVAESIRGGSLTLVAVNGFPMQAEVWMVGLDENQQVTDTLVNGISVAAPSLDADLKVISPLESRLQVPIPASTAERLTLARRVSITARFNTAENPQLVDIYSHYDIDIKLIGDLNINLNASKN